MKELFSFSNHVIILFTIHVYTVSISLESNIIIMFQKHYTTSVRQAAAIIRPNNFALEVQHTL